jgi:hypothetical protein
MHHVRLTRLHLYPIRNVFIAVRRLSVSARAEGVCVCVCAPQLVESIRTATAQGRVPLLLDCTTRKGTVDTFFLYQRAFVIDMKTEVRSTLVN